MITLHEYRWPFAAVRAAIWISVLAVWAISDPAATLVTPRVHDAPRFRLRHDDIRVEVWREGFVFPSDLRWLVEHNRSSRVVIRADRAAPMRSVRAVFEALRRAGVRHVTLEVQPFEPLLTRRLAAGFEIDRDFSKLTTPPEEPGGAFFRIDHNIWY